MKAFEARYDGHCPKCEERIKAGDQVRYEGGFNYRELVHSGCQERQGRPVTVCQRCFIAKAANGSCGCEQ